MISTKISNAMQVFRVSGIRGVGAPMRASINPPPVVWSEYLSWLSFANAGMLDRGNVWCFDYALTHLPSAAPMLEIGSFCGLSTNVITHLKQRHQVSNRLITCDKWLFEGYEAGGKLADSSDITHDAYRQFVKDTFHRNVRMFSGRDLPFTLELLSDELFEAWAAKRECVDVFDRPIQLGGPLSFCYIDGNHSYDFAKRDFENCDRFLEPGGFVLFDDSGDGAGWEGKEWEVCRVVREVNKSGRYELISRNPNYFFRKK